LLTEILKFVGYLIGRRWEIKEKVKKKMEEIFKKEQN